MVLKLELTAGLCDLKQAKDISGLSSAKCVTVGVRGYVEVFEHVREHECVRVYSGCVSS